MSALRRPPLARREQRGLKLHLGCGEVHLDGYINIDATKSEKVDLCVDIRQIHTVFRPGSVTEVLMIHVLSYLNLWEARVFFRHVHQILEPGGRLIIETPDVAKCAHRLVASEGNNPAYLEAVRGIYAFDMGQIESRETYTPYAFGWSAWHLTHELADAGFRDTRICEPQTHGPRPWRDIRVEATKPLTGSRQDG